MKNDFFKVGKYTREDIIENYNQFIDSGTHLNMLVRSTRLQNEKIDEIEEYVKHIKDFKRQAASQGNESFANLLFHFQCMLRAVQASLKMWVLVKEEEYQKAWSSLVDAEEYTEVAKRAVDHEGPRAFSAYLGKVRDLIFPKWSRYNSVAFSTTIGKCSICGQSFDECDHVEGVIYMGRLCRRFDLKITDVNHVGIVEHPRDRRCIIPKISNDSGVMIDVFTQEETGEVREKEEGVAGHMEGIIMSAVTLDFD